MIGSGHLSRAALWLYRIALLAYPKAWRGRFGADHREVTLARWRAVSSRGHFIRVAVVLFDLADACWSGLLTRLEAAHSRGSREYPEHRRAAMEKLWRHISHGARSLAHARGFTMLTGLTLAVGIGSATAAFTAFDAALLEPLPYPASDRLAVIAETRRGREISVSYPDFLDWKRATRSFEALASFRGVGVTLTGGQEPERVAAQIVNADLFRLLGTAAAVGRVFTPDDDRKGAARTAVLGYPLWQRLYGGDTRIAGRTIQIDGHAWEIVGAMPPDFSFPDGVVYGAADLYLPVGAAWISDLEIRDNHPGLAVIGSLAPGVTLAQAREEMHGIAAGLAKDHPDTNAEIGVVVDDAVSVMVGDLRGRLETVTIGASVLLLIACTNVAGLTLTRALSRRRELAVRAALGETRAALAASFVAEHLLLGALGASGGLGLAFLFTWALRPLLAPLPRLDGLSPDLSALALSAAICVGVAVVLGLMPMAWMRRVSSSASLGTRGQTTQGLKTRHALVAVQIALALTLLTAALLFTASFRALSSDPGGIDPDGTLTFQLQLPDEGDTGARSLTFVTALEERLAGLPGVTAVGAISTLPFSGAGSQSRVRPAGAPVDAQVSVDVAAVTPGYFEAMGVPLRRGRGFVAADSAAAPAVAVVDERMAARFWPGEDPIGKRLQGWGFAGLEVVGVAGHVKNYGVGRPSREELYVSLAQRPASRLSFVVRTTGDPAALPSMIRPAVAELDSGRPVHLVRTMREVVNRTIAAPRLGASLSTAFGTTAVILAAIGLYGLVSFVVELRRREAGIRLALGATSGAVTRLMIRGVSAAGIAGGIAGIAGAIAVGRWIQSELFGVSATDPRLIAAASVALCAVVLLAGWLPARRAARVPPAIVLQQD